MREATDDTIMPISLCNTHEQSADKQKMSKKAYVSLFCFGGAGPENGQRVC